MDANVVVSALLKKGVTFDVFLLNHIFRKFELVAPEFLMVEVERHRGELSRETKLSEDEFNEVMRFLMGEIDLIPSSQFADFLSKGKEISPDFKDFEYFALALNLSFLVKRLVKQLKEEREMIDWPVKLPRASRRGRFDELKRKGLIWVKFVVDTNVMFTYFWPGSFTKGLLVDQDLKFFAPELALLEINEHRRMSSPSQHGHFIARTSFPGRQPRKACEAFGG